MFVEYIVGNTAHWERQAREGRAWWLPFLSWSARINVVALMGMAKAILAVASRLNADEYGGARAAEFSLWQLVGGTRLAEARLMGGDQQKLVNTLVDASSAGDKATTLAMRTFGASPEGRESKFGFRGSMRARSMPRPPSERLPPSLPSPFPPPRPQTS